MRLVLLFFAYALAQGQCPDDLSALGRWERDKSEWATGWLAQRGTEQGPPEYIDFHVIGDVAPLAPATDQAKATKALYDQKHPPEDPASLVHTFIESGSPNSKGYQWDSHRWSGLNSPKTFERMVHELKKQGIKNVRLGLNAYEIDLDKPHTWAGITEKIDILHRNGMGISVSIDFFNGMERFRTNDPSTSHHLNPAWPDHFARLAAETARRFGDKVKMVNIINEPETVNGFNAQFWHNAHPGWSSPKFHEFYIDRAIALGKASVKARLAYDANAKSRTLYMHNEAMINPEAAEFREHRRFLTSDAILGQKWLLETDFRKLKEWPSDGMLGWLHREYVLAKPPAERAAARAKLTKNLAELRDLHLRTNMRKDTILAVDYYYQNEYQPQKTMEQLERELLSDDGAGLKRVLGVTQLPPGRPNLKELLGLIEENGQIKLGFEPQYYARQMRAGVRVGFYGLARQYLNRYQDMPFAVGESGTPFYTFAPMLHDQVLMEMGALARAGALPTFYSAGPAIHTRGWGKSPLGGTIKDDHEINPSGLTQLDRRLDDKGRPDFHVIPMPWVPNFLGPLHQDLRR